MEDLLVAAALGGINDQEIEEAILHDINRQRRAPRLRRMQFGRFDLDLLSDEDVQLNFRFQRQDLQRLTTALGIPNEVRTQNRHAVSGLTGICIYLRRLAYPNRLSDLEWLFGLSAPYLSDISQAVMRIIVDNWSHLLTNLGNLPWLNMQKLDNYAQAIAEKGAALNNCWGFIDGTARAICRPSVNQEDYFSGHKRFHCLKYQSVLCPDGMITSLMGPFLGRRHDAGIFQETNLYEQLEECTTFPDGTRYVLYGDQAYGIRELLLCPYSNRQLTNEQQAFNNSMKPLRQAVEWGFAKIIAEFAFLDFRKNQKLLLQDLGAMYASATILINCHTSLYGSQTSTYFNIDPPPLEQYLN